MKKTIEVEYVEGYLLEVDQGGDGFGYGSTYCSDDYDDLVQQVAEALGSMTIDASKMAAKCFNLQKGTWLVHEGDRHHLEQESASDLTAMDFLQQVFASEKYRVTKEATLARLLEEKNALIEKAAAHQRKSSLEMLKYYLDKYKNDDDGRKIIDECLSS